MYLSAQTAQYTRCRKPLPAGLQLKRRFFCFVMNRMKKEIMALYLVNEPRQRLQLRVRRFPPQTACMALYMPKLYPLTAVCVERYCLNRKHHTLLGNVISVISLRENCYILRRNEIIVPSFDPVKLLTNLNRLKQNTEKFPFVNYKMITWEETTK